MQKIRNLIPLIQKFLNQLKKDAVSAYAAQAAFFIMLSVFPFFMFLLTLIQYLPLTEQDLIEMISTAMPSAIAPFLTNIISEIYTSSSATLLSITAITAVWGASKAFFSLIHGLNSVYGIAENRNYFILRFFATIYTVIFALMLIVTLGLLAFGNRIALAIEQMIHALSDLAILMISIRATESMCILVLFFLCLYIFIPNRKSRLLAELPGAIITSAGWIGFSYLYSFYIDHMSSFGNTYGSLTAIVLLMLWLYACMYMLLIGGEINVVFQKHSILKIIEKL